MRIGSRILRLFVLAGSLIAWIPMGASLSPAGAQTRWLDEPPTAEAPRADRFGKLIFARRSTVNVRHFGARGDGRHDDTVAVRAAIDSLSARGGVVFFPAGRYRIGGQIVLPHDGASADTRQTPYTLQGVGALFDGRGGPPNGGTILDLRYAHGPKIVTHGLGLLELDAMTLADFGDDDQAFIYTTNTTLHVHDCGFYGTREGVLAQNDAIVLGGTNAAGTGSDDPNAPFQGYATVIRDNYFGRTRRMVYGRVFANSVAVYGNTMWSNSGSNLPDGAALELDGDPDDVTSQVNVGWYVAGNLFEVTNYAYGIKVRQSQRNVFIANSFYDATDTTLAYYRFEPTGRLNYVVAGFHDDAKTFVDDQATGNSKSTVINFHQNEESAYAQRARFLNRLYLEPGSASPHGPRVVSSGGAELTYQLVNDSSVVWSNTQVGESPVTLWQVTDLGGGRIVQDLKGTDSSIRNLNGSVKVHSQAGAPAEIGDVNGLGIRVEGGDVELTSTSVRILTGSGPPAEIAPDGSIYLRTDGGAGSTFFVREAGAWVAK
jgi:hypothetical protein